jgi:transcriptional regulator with XRE-family HTH domain
MGRQPHNKNAHPEIGKAFRLLRHRAGLRQRDVASKAAESGAHLSEIYYRQVELGKRTPSESMVETVLSSLGATRDELEAVLVDDDALTYAGQLEDTNYRTPSNFAALADEKPMLRGMAPVAKTQMFGGASPLMRSAASASPLTQANLAFEASRSAAPVNPQVEAEIAEHSTLYRSLSRHAQVSLHALYDHFAKLEGLKK